MDRKSHKSLLHELKVHQAELEAQNEELRTTRDELEALLARYTDLYEFAPVGYFTVDRAGNIRAANLTATKLLGVSRSILVGSPLAEYITGQTWGNFTGCLDRAFTSGVNETCEVEFQRENRPPLHGRIEALASGSVEECRVAVIDISPRKQAESDLQHTVDALQQEIAERTKLELQLLQSQKMEAVGMFAGGVAHDFNNLLTAISGYSEELLENLPENSAPLRECVEQVLMSANRATDLTRRLLAFSRKQEFVLKPVQIDSIVEHAGILIQRMIGEDVELRISPSGKDLAVMADAGQIELMLMNLATNARDAMPTGGCLSISIRQLPVDKGSEAIYGLPAPGTYALISVSDTGAGIAPKDVERIFEPFYTTKEVGKGTGLGLSIVYGIVKQHNGSAQVRSQPSRGTTFKIYLPLLKRRAIREEANRAEAPAGGTETILVAEDEEIVKNFLVKILERAGYTVLTADNVDDALALFKEHEDIVLVLSDVIMPGKNGQELVSEICRIRPGTRAIFVSGYTADVIRNKGLIDHEIEMIMKPFTKRDLLLKIREVLDRDSAGSAALPGEG